MRDCVYRETWNCRRWHITFKLVVLRIEILKSLYWFLGKMVLFLLETQIAAPGVLFAKHLDIYGRHPDSIERFVRTYSNSVNARKLRFPFYASEVKRIDAAELVIFGSNFGSGRLRQLSFSPELKIISSDNSLHRVEKLMEQATNSRFGDLYAIDHNTGMLPKMYALPEDLATLLTKTDLRNLVDDFDPNWKLEEFRVSGRG